MRHHGIGGEDDGHGTAKSHPGHKALGLERQPAERHKAKTHGERTCHEDHEQAYEQGTDRNIEHLVGIDQQTQRKEHNNLSEPRETVHKGVYLFAEYQSGITHHDTQDVDGQITVAMEHVGDGEGDEDEAQKKNGI